MQLGQTADPSIGFYPNSDDEGGWFRPLTEVRPSARYRIDPATAAMLNDEFRGAPLTAEPTPQDFTLPPRAGEPVETDRQMSLVAVGIGAALVLGSLWYFNR